jgi:hypothetical protein
MRLCALLLAGCAVSAPPPPQAARPDATTGQLAGAPAALRAGVVSYPDLPTAQTPAVHHHHHP